MGFFEGLKNLFFRKRKEDARNEPKHLKVTYKPKPPEDLAEARKASKKGRGWKRRATRQWCPGSIVPAGERKTAPREELMRHMPPWFKRQLRREALQKAFSPRGPAPLMTPEQRTAAVQKVFGPPTMLNPLAPENQPDCIKPQTLVAGPGTPPSARRKLDK